MQKRFFDYGFLSFSHWFRNILIELEASAKCHWKLSLIAVSYLIFLTIMIDTFFVFHCGIKLTRSQTDFLHYLFKHEMWYRTISLWWTDTSHDSSPWDALQKAGNGAINIFPSGKPEENVKLIFHEKQFKEARDLFMQWRCFHWSNLMQVSLSNKFLINSIKKMHFLF